jgi:lipoprotein-anchoring transpeptidase ErfK/SrfK
MPRRGPWWLMRLVALATLGCPAGVAAAADHVGPPTRAGAWIARPVIATPVWKHPAPRRSIGTLEPGGTTTGLLVLRARRDHAGRRWLRVQLPRRPNGVSGWVAADRVALRRTPWRLKIRLGTRTVALLHRGRTVRRFRAVVGAPATPTPIGRFAIFQRARQPNPHGFLGPWALQLTAHSNVLKRYDGGSGRVALHGRDGAGLLDPLGTARSHGCVRLTNPAIRLLAHRLAAGTPVDIRR